MVNDFDYKNVLNALNCQICVYNKQGVILYCNDLFRNTYLKEYKTLEGLTFKDIRSDKYKSISFIDKAFNIDKPISQQRTYGTSEIFEVSITPSLDSTFNKILIEAIYYAYGARDFDNKEIEDFSSEKMINSDVALKGIIETISRIANFDSTILITGESGTGKSMLAKYIHENSRRFKEPFVTINCATIPENLIESELFGYAPGAFTGASIKGKPGMVELADNGTLFLDEIGLLQLSLQTKFLQLIQEKTYTPVGSIENKKVDIRIISATNLNLEKQVIAGKFREDLYYRLRVIEFNMPPLRQRLDAIDLLIDYFLEQFSKQYNVQKSISDNARSTLKLHNWPGNIRELQYVIERLVATSPGPQIDAINVPPLSSSNTSSPISSPDEILFDQEVERFEKNILKKAYEKHKSSYKVADALGITQTKASRLIRKYGIK